MVLGGQGGNTRIIQYGNDSVSSFRRSTLRRFFQTISVHGASVIMMIAAFFVGLSVFVYMAYVLLKPEKF
jgi:hypothetical protein